MDFFAHQDQARRGTRRLVLLFLVAVALVVGAVYLAVAISFLGNSGSGVAQRLTWGTLWNPELFGWSSGATLAVILGGMLYKILQLRAGGVAVARNLGGRLLKPGTRDPLERKLLNVVAEMAIASGVTTPPVFVMDNETGINAFAAGNGPNDAVIGVTRGCLELLNRDELQGVIGHEFSHILNGDMRLNMRLIGILSGILLISQVGGALLQGGSRRRHNRSHFSSSASHSSSRDRGGGGGFLLGLALFVIGYIGFFMGNLIKAAVSRQREFLADASSVQFTRNPAGIAGALKRIMEHHRGARVFHANAEENSHLFFGQAVTGWLGGLTATHPPLEERIRRIDASLLQSRRQERAPAPEVGASTPEVGGAMGFAGGATGAEPVAAARSGPWGDAPAEAAQPVAAEALSARVGTLGPEQVSYAVALVEGMPEAVAEALTEPLGARALVCAMLMGNNREEAKAQLQILLEQGGRPLLERVVALHRALRGVERKVRLPLVELALSPLGELTPEEVTPFKELVNALVMADQQVTLFEFSLRKLLFHALDGRFHPEGVVRFRRSIRSYRQVRNSLAVLLSSLAHQGHGSVEGAVAAFNAAVRTFRGVVSLTLLPPEECGVEALDKALDRLRELAPEFKRPLIDACAASVAADGEITPEEGEVLRVVCGVLECPLPPLVG